MSKMTTQEQTLTSNSGQKIIRVKAGSKEFEEMFLIVDIENVTLEDSFMQYEPETNLEKRVKANIIKAKEIGMKNFRKPCMDPSFADDGKTIIYCAGKRPAVGKSAEWWDENAPKFMPKKNSRLIDDLQKDVSLGIQIKELVDGENKVREAWKAVCVNSTGIGHYKNSKNAKKYDFERTGSRKIGKWYDLGNTYKIVKKHNALGFVHFGGSYMMNGDEYPLAGVYPIPIPYDYFIFSVGEIVLDV